MATWHKSGLGWSNNSMGNLDFPTFVKILKLNLRRKTTCTTKFKPDSLS
jgi:hypothetical protein